MVEVTGATVTVNKYAMALLPGAPGSRAFFAR